MATSLSFRKQKYLEILKAFNETIENAPWGDSIFLQAIRKKLEELRDQFKKEAHLTEEDLQDFQEKKLVSLISEAAKHQGFQEIFVVLYNADGANISKWEVLLNSIEKQSINRPTYAEEEFARAALRGASQKYNEAYVSIFIRESDIASPSMVSPVKDRFGNSLIILKDSAIKKENIYRFVHKSGVYEFENNKLVWQEKVEYL